VSAKSSWISRASVVATAGFAKAFAELFAFTEQFTERLIPPPPLETLGTRPGAGTSAESDYPPSTCYVRVVRLGFGYRNRRHVSIRGWGRAGTLPEPEGRRGMGWIVRGRQ